VMPTDANQFRPVSGEEQGLCQWSRAVWWFEPEDAQQLVNDVLNHSFNQLLHSTRVEGQVVRLRDQAG